MSAARNTRGDAGIPGRDARTGVLARLVRREQGRHPVGESRRGQTAADRDGRESVGVLPVRSTPSTESRFAGRSPTAAHRQAGTQALTVARMPGS